MKTKINLFLLILVKTFLVESIESNLNVKFITMNFYDSLQKRYTSKLVDNGENIERISEEISNFHKSLKRSIDDYAADPYENEYDQQIWNTDVFKFVKLEEISNLQTSTIVDMTLFCHQSVESSMNWFIAAILEDYKTDKSTIVLYQFYPNFNSWKSISEEEVPKSSAIRSAKVEQGTLLAIAGKYKMALYSGLTVFLLNKNKKLQNVQSLETELFSDFAVWNDLDNTYLLSAIDHNKEEYNINYEFRNPIYVWKGSHFDILQYIFSSNARKVISFQIGINSFFAIANYKNNYGEMKISSEIFKYDSQTSEFFSFQKLATNGAINMESFSFHSEISTETFLMIINRYPIDEGKEYQSNTIVYKSEGEKLFVPFQYIVENEVEKWLPLIDGKKCVLFAICRYGIVKAYQYNGWRFVSVPNQSFDKLPVNTKIKSFTFQEKPVIVTWNGQGDSNTLILKPTYYESNPLKETETSMVTWTKMVQQAIDCTDRGHLERLKALEKYHEVTNTTSGRPILMNRSKIDHIETEAIYSADFQFGRLAIQNINNIFSSLHSQLTSIKSLSEIASLALLSDSRFTMKSLNIENLKLTMVPFFKQFFVGTINDKNVTRYQNEMVYVHGGMDQYNKIEIDHLGVISKLNARKFNGKQVEDIRKFIHSLAENKGLTVKGNVVMRKGFSIAGTLDGVKLNNEMILLKEGNQHFRGKFSITQIHADILETPQINDVHIETFKHSIINENKTVTSMTGLFKLTVNNLFLKNRLNGIGLKSLEEEALRFNGNQSIKGNIKILNLNANKIIANKKRGLGGFVKISDETLNVEDGVYLEEFVAKELIVEKRFNSISVKDKSLQVLQLESKSEQTINGEKMFENVELMGPVNLQGKISKGILERKNPVSMIEQPIVLKGDYVIRGNVSIESLINCDNMIKSSEEKSLKQLQQRAIKLSDDRIDTHLIFSQPLEAKVLTSDTINGINPISWISSENEEKLPISGKKIFRKNLKIAGNCVISKTVNEMNPSMLINNIMNIFGDQEIKGNISVANITTQSVSCGNARLGKSFFGDILTNTQNYLISGITTVNNFAFVENVIFANKTQVLGEVSKWIIEDMIKDTVFMDERQTIYLPGYFKINNLIIENLFKLSNVIGVNVDDVISKEDWKKIYNYDNSIRFNSAFSVNRIYFEIAAAGISKADFGHSWMLSVDDQVLRGDNNLFEMSCIGGIEVDLAKVNDLNIVDIGLQVIWIDQDFYLETVVFQNEVFVNDLLDAAYIDGVGNSQNFIKRSSKDVPQIINGTKVVLKNVDVIESIATYYLSNVSLDYFCALMNPSGFIRHSLILEGNLIMNYEPTINKIFGYPLKQITESAWFQDVPFIHLKTTNFDTVVFKSDVTIEGLINGVDLNWIAENFMSLNSDQETVGVLNITHVLAKTVVTENKTNVEGLNGIQVEVFYENLLRTNDLQYLGQDLKFETVTVQGDLIVNGNVNNLNLNIDIVHIAEKNIISGNKYFNNIKINIENLFTKYVQNFDIDYIFANSLWINKSPILYIEQSKFMKFAQIPNLNIQGYLNNATTNYLSIDAYPKIISGKKTFLVNDFIYLHNIDVYNTINSFNFTYMLQMLVLKNREKIEIFTPKKFFGISTKNVLVGNVLNEKPFNIIMSGIEYGATKNDFNDKVTPLIVKSQNDFDEFEKGKSLLLYDFETDKIVQEIQYSVIFYQSGVHYLIIATRIPNLSSLITIYRWDIEISSFLIDENYKPLHMDSQVSKLYSVNMYNQTIVLIETLNYDDRLIHIYDFDIFGFTKIQEVQSNTTLSVGIMHTDSQKCLILAGSNSLSYCSFKSQNNFRVKKTTPLYNVTKIQTIKINKMQHLIASKSENVEVYHLENDGKFTLLQTLSPASLFSVTTWNNNHYLVTAFLENIEIHRFSTKLQRFIKLQTIHQTGNIVDLKLDTIEGKDLILNVLHEEKEQNKLFMGVYTYNGLAGFIMFTKHFLNIDYVINMMIFIQENFLIVAFATYNHIKIMEFNFIS